MDFERILGEREVGWAWVRYRSDDKAIWGASGKLLLTGVVGGVLNSLTAGSIERY
jgi:hypothetical protein